MATTLAQILVRLDQVLQLNAVPGTKVFSDRVDAESRDEVPCLNTVVHNGSTEPFSDDWDLYKQPVELRISVRGDQPTLLAELQHEAVHRPITADATLKTLAVSVRAEDPAWERVEGDLTAVIKSTRYLFTYLIPRNTL